VELAFSFSLRDWNPVADGGQVDLYVCIFMGWKKLIVISITNNNLFVCSKISQGPFIVSVTWRMKQLQAVKMPPKVISCSCRAEMFAPNVTET
jgi:hypothetical protein